MRILYSVIVSFLFVYVPVVYAKAEFILDKSPDFLALSKVDFSALCQTANTTMNYLNTQGDDSYAVHGGESLLPFSNVEKVKNTLIFLCKVHSEDQQKKGVNRLVDKTFLLQHFDFYQWQPDTEKATLIAKKSTNERKAEMLNTIPQDKILLTKYYTKLLEGSAVKTAQYNQALYALPDDEQGLSLEQAEFKAKQLTRFKYTRQQVISGVLEVKKLAKPLVWITEDALHDVLLQGTGVLKVNGKIRYFNVHRNNGISYDYAIGKTAQKRYWYFAEVPSIMGYGKNIESKIAINPYVSFAGNVKQLGLGKLFLVSSENVAESNKSVTAIQPFVQLGILADEGGAFDDNLFQLDYLVGTYQGWADYHQANKALPDYTKAWLMLKKQ